MIYFMLITNVTGEFIASAEQKNVMYFIHVNKRLTFVYCSTENENRKADTLSIPK